MVGNLTPESVLNLLLKASDSRQSCDTMATKPVDAVYKVVCGARKRTGLQKKSLLGAASIRTCRCRQFIWRCSFNVQAHWGSISAGGIVGSRGEEVVVTVRFMRYMAGATAPRPRPSRWPVTWLTLRCSNGVEASSWIIVRHRWLLGQNLRHEGIRQVIGKSSPGGLPGMQRKTNTLY